MLVSVFMLFVDPNVKITFGSASFAGLGISVNPPQTLPLGIFLLALLIYRLIAFWASVLIESGTDASRAKRKALLAYDPGWEVDEHRPDDMEQLIKEESGGIVYRWSVRQLIWDFLIPNLLAVIALCVYFIKYFELYK